MRAGRYPSGQRGQTVNLLADAFGGSNPPLPTIALGDERYTTDIWRECGNSSAVERQPSKLGVAGSNPVSRSSDIEEPTALPGATNVGGLGAHVGAPMKIGHAHVAQSAERVLGKDEVSVSIPDMGSISIRIATANGRV